MAPKYSVIAEILRERIKDKLYPRGEPIPAIPDLKEEFSASSGTIRAAVGQLADEGLVTPLRGVGTIVCDPSKVPLVHRPNWASLVWSQQKPSGSHVLVEAEWGTADEELAARLRIDPGDRVLRRLHHYANLGTRVSMIQRQWVPGWAADIVATKTGADLADVEKPPTLDLYTLLRDAGIPPLQRTEDNSPHELEGPDCDVLDVRAGGAVMITTRVTVDFEGRPLEASIFTGHDMHTTYTMPLASP